MNARTAGALLAAACLGLTACSSTSQSADGGAGSAPSASVSALSTPARSTATKSTLRATCPRVARAVKDFESKPGDSVLEAATALEILSQGGDARTRDALDPLVTALAGYREARSEGTAGLPEAMASYRSARTHLAIRCKAAGSSALL